MIAAELRAALEGTRTPAEAKGPIRNPYKGLRAFLEADTPDFFGREAVTERLIRSLAEDDPAARFLAVVGPSGSGSPRSCGRGWSRRSGVARSPAPSAGSSSTCCPARTRSTSSRPR